jgi:hypothetical protein
MCDSSFESEEHELLEYGKNRDNDYLKIQLNENCSIFNKNQEMLRTRRKLFVVKFSTIFSRWVIRIDKKAQIAVQFIEEELNKKKLVSVVLIYKNFCSILVGNRKFVFWLDF